MFFTLNSKKKVSVERKKSHVNEDSEPDAPSVYIHTFDPENIDVFFSK